MLSWEKASSRGPVEGVREARRVWGCKIELMFACNTRFGLLL